MDKGLNLLIPEKPDIERDQVAQAWLDAGGQVTRLGRFWEPPELDKSSVRIYANDTFSWVVAQKLNLQLMSPADDLLVHLPYEWTKRTVHICTLGELAHIRFPTFIKSAAPKLFKAAVYANAQELREETKGLEPQTSLLVSGIVQFTAEVRSFILDGRICDTALYEGNTSNPAMNAALLDDANKLIKQIASSALLPEACIIDVGLIPQHGWAIIEANAAWGGGLNGCSADKVISCIAKASRPLPD